MTGRKADVILAAYYAAEAALRLLKPGSNVYIVIYIPIVVLISNLWCIYIELSNNRSDR